MEIELWTQELQKSQKELDLKSCSTEENHKNRSHRATVKPCLSSKTDQQHKTLTTLSFPCHHCNPLCMAKHCTSTATHRKGYNVSPLHTWCFFRRHWNFFLRWTGNRRVHNRCHQSTPAKFNNSASISSPTGNVCSQKVGSSCIKNNWNTPGKSNRCLNIWPHRYDLHCSALMPYHLTDIIKRKQFPCLLFDDAPRVPSI